MGLFGLNKLQKRVKGSIGYFGLGEWWLSTFSDEERRYIQSKYQPMGSSGDSLTTGEISYNNETAVRLLYILACWLSKKEDRPIAYKMLEKAEELVKADTPVLDIHFLYSQKITIYYKGREKPDFMARAIEACKQQIELAQAAAKAFKTEWRNSSLPAHKGYEQLAIILEKQKRFEEAIELCTMAEEQGWAGDWGKRIGRLKRKSQCA